MNRTTANSGNSRKLTTSGLSNISPKTMAAVVLMSAMVILWGRVLLRGKGGPETAGAQEIESRQSEIAAAETNVPAAVQISPVQLPFVAGRHDKLSADMFATDRWMAFDFSGDLRSKTVQVEADGQTEQKAHLANLDTLAGELKLEAVIEGADGMQAFIDGKILTAGQSLTVRRQSQVYELVLTELDAQHAVLKWGTYSIRLKITESQEQ